MAKLGEVFDVNNLPQSQGEFEPLPPGWYQAVITEAELKTTSSGTGQYIKLRYDILGPSHQGRVVFGNINVRNQSVKAEEIGRQQLGDLMRAIGLTRVEDTDQFVGSHVQIKLAIRENEQYGPQNEVKGFKAVSNRPEVSAVRPQELAASKPQTQQAAKSVPPWAMRT